MSYHIGEFDTKEIEKLAYDVIRKISVDKEEQVITMQEKEKDRDVEINGALYNLDDEY